jgi:hypothetical protein
LKTSQNSKKSLRKSIPLFLLFFLICTIHAQQTSVPFRVGNQFGLSNREGKMILNPQFDILEPDNFKVKNCFVGYHFKEGKITSNYILENKILLKDQTFDAYYNYGYLILAYDYLVDDRNKNVSIDFEVPQDVQLFTKKGNPLFKEKMNEISLIDDMHEPAFLEKSNHVLIFAIKKNKTFDLHLFDKKLDKIVQTFIKNATSLDINHSSNGNNDDYSVTYFIRNENGETRKIKIQSQKGIISKVADEAFVAPPAKRERDNYYDNVMVPNEGYERMPSSMPEGQSKLDKIQKINIKRGFYFLPKKQEAIFFSTQKMEQNSDYLVSENGKVGFYSKSYNKLIVPTLYDEIYLADFEGRNGGYVLRNDKKFGLFIYDYPSNKTIEPVFEKTPLLFNYDYFDEKDPLIALFDENGLFFCYANQDGFLYYKP